MDEKRHITPWIKTRLREFRDAKTKETIAGVVVDVYVSPYDVPERMRGFFDDENKRFVLEFKYMADEPTERVKENDHVELCVGVKTGRIYSVEIDVGAVGAHAVAVSVGEKKPSEKLEQAVIEAMRRYVDEHPKVSKANYRAAARAFEKQGGQVLDLLAF
ncbi:MAG: hypothetical protein GC159_22475 [Phycisphaera sp.]|nr:hypothetical protein [Phycisphaera sp.]